MASLFTKTQLVTTCHNWTRTSKRLVVYSSTDKYLLRNFDIIVTVADEIRDELMKKGISNKNIVTIYNGVCIERFNNHHDCNQLRGELGIPDNYKVIGTVGRLSPEKGFTFLLRAAKTIINNFPETVFLIAGEGPFKNELMKESLSLGIEKQVIFTGLRNDIEKIYSLMDIFILPSFNEGLPMSLLEAMASQKPAISTKVGAIPRIIDHGKNGLLIKAGDAIEIINSIEYMLRNQDIAKDIAINGYNTVASHFSSKVMVDSYREIYKAYSMDN